MDLVEVRVRLFGRARELMACEEVRMRLPMVISSIELKETVFEQLGSDLAPISSACILAVDQKYIDDESTLHLTTSSEVAIIPPLSGG